VTRGGAMQLVESSTGNQKLRERRRRGSKTAALLAEALNNMPHGVLMFDATAHLLVCNQRYIDMYSLPADGVKPGCSLRELIEQRKATGLFSGDVARYCAEILATIARGETASQEIVTTDCRRIHVVNQPIPSGGWVATHEDVTQRRLAEHMAHHDALTDLPNRALLRIQLDEALRQTMRDQQLAVLFLDLDKFKGINDTLGHHIGDALLKTVAERLRGCVRDTDIVARLGGDEFVVVQTLTEQPSDAAALAARVRDAIITPCDLADHHVVIDASIGIALAPHDGTTADQLIRNADMALYSAKANGRGTYRFFEQDMDARMIGRRELEIALHEALVNGEFEIHYQPRLNLERGSISSCEALLRWRHPARGMVPPSEFIGVAEEIGLITRIGEWVIRTACTEAATWPDDVSVAVNISPVQFREQNLALVVTQALSASGLPAERLEIEITEAILMEQTEATLAVLRQLHALGVRVAMDGFGTGHSSLSYLRKFPFYKIKIDRSFVNSLSGKDETMAIVRAVTEVATSFHMLTTAEGVETAQQRDIVSSLGCTEIQGHLFSTARPADEIAKLLNSSGTRRTEAARTAVRVRLLIM